MDEHEEEMYVLTMSEIMRQTLIDYGYEPPTQRVAEHMINDLMDRLCMAGWVGKQEE